MEPIEQINLACNALKNQAAEEARAWADARAALGCGPHETLVDAAKRVRGVASDAYEEVVVEVIRTLGYGPHDSAVAAAAAVVRERDLLRDERDAARRERDSWRLEVRNELGACPDESEVQAAIRVIRERNEALEHVEASAITHEVMVELRTTLGAGRAENVRDAAKRVVRELAGVRGVLDDVRAALGSPSGSLTEAARQIMTEARRAGDAQETARVARETEEYAIAEMKKAQARADEWARRCSKQVPLNAMARYIHNNACAHGWWTDGASLALDPIKRVPECLALIHSEVSEALEAYRESDGTATALRTPLLVFPVLRHMDGTAGVGKPVGFASELADVVIRVLDLSAALGIDIEAAIEAKHAYNKTRPMRHGGKLC